MNIYHTTKTCINCGIEQTTANFHKFKQSKDGLKTICKSCTSKYSKEYYDVNSEKIKLASINYKESHAVSAKLWRQTNSYIVNSYTAKRKATKLQATPFWSETKQIQSIYKEAKRIEQETGIKQHVDHIVPLESDLVCGLHVFANLRIITASENCSKGNRHRPDMP